MVEVFNLRAARKRAKRRDDETRAQANRIAHGRTKSENQLAATRRDKAHRNLDAHRIGRGDAS